MKKNELVKKGEVKVNFGNKLKEPFKKKAPKAYAIGSAAFLALTPTAAFAAAPSTYVNKISDSLFGEILKVAPKIALVVVGFEFLMYLISGDEHKKSKHRTGAFVAIGACLILLVLKPLMNWIGGLV